MTAVYGFRSGVRPCYTGSVREAKKKGKGGKLKRNSFRFQLRTLHPALGLTVSSPPLGTFLGSPVKVRGSIGQRQSSLGSLLCLMLKLQSRCVLRQRTAYARAAKLAAVQRRRLLTLAIETSWLVPKFPALVFLLDIIEEYLTDYAPAMTPQ